MGDEQYVGRSVEYSQAIDPSLVRHLVDFDEVIDHVRLILGGKDIDYSKTPPEVISFGSPLLSDVGLSRITMKLKIIHKGIPVGTYDKNTPYIFTRIMALNLAKEMFDNWESYGLQTIADADKIIEMTIAAFMAAFSRAVGGGEKTFIKGIARESHGIGVQKSGRIAL